MDLGWIALGAALGGFVNGLAGFGTALFALGIWLAVLPPADAVALSVIVATITGLQGLWLVRRQIWIDLGRLARFLLPAFLGLPIGVLGLAVIDAQGLRVLIGALMMSYGLFFWARGALPNLSRPFPAIDVAIGFVSGILGGLAGISGGILVMWCGMQAWTKQQIRAVLQPFNFCILATMVAIFASRGHYDPAEIGRLAVALPCSICAAQVGILTFKRLSDLQFRWLLMGLMSVFGAALILRALF